MVDTNCQECVYLLTIEGYFDLLFIPLSGCSVTILTHCCTTRTHTCTHSDTIMHAHIQICTHIHIKKIACVICWLTKKGNVHAHAHADTYQRRSQSFQDFRSYPNTSFINTNNCFLFYSYLLYTNMPLPQLRATQASEMMCNYEQQQTGESISNIAQN